MMILSSLEYFGCPHLVVEMTSSPQKKKEKKERKEKNEREKTRQNKKRNDDKNWHLNLIQSRGVGFDIVTRLMRTPVEH